MGLVRDAFGVDEYLTIGDGNGWRFPGRCFRHHSAFGRLVAALVYASFRTAAARSSCPCRKPAKKSFVFIEF